MPDQRGVGIRDSLQQAIRHGGAILIELRVDAGYHNIQLFKYGVREIERAVAENINLNPRKNSDALHLLLDFTNSLEMSERALVGEAIGKGQILRVIGDCHVLVTTIAC